MHSLSKTTPIYAMLMISLLFAAPLSAQDKVRVGLSSVSATNGSIWVAEDKGLFKKPASMSRSLSSVAAAPASSARWLRVIYTFRSAAAKAPSVPSSGEPTRSSQPLR